MRLYPTAIEEQNAQTWLSLVDPYLIAVQRGTVRKISTGPFRKDGPLDIVSEFLEAIGKKFALIVASKKTEKALRRNVELVDQHASKIIEVELPKLHAKSLGVKYSDRSGVTDELLETFVRQNAGLIKRVTLERHRESVIEAVIAAVRDGDTLAQLSDKIEAATDVSRSRAEFWARDQVSKAMGDISKARQVGAGFEWFEWSTAKDARVRETHRALGGRIYPWARGAVIGGRVLFPGLDYRCRCVAVPRLNPASPEAEEAKNAEQIRAIEADILRTEQAKKEHGLFLRENEAA